MCFSNTLVLRPHDFGTAARPKRRVATLNCRRAALKQNSIMKLEAHDHSYLLFSTGKNVQLFVLLPGKDYSISNRL